MHISLVPASRFFFFQMMHMMTSTVMITPTIITAPTAAPTKQKSPQPEMNNEI